MMDDGESRYEVDESPRSAVLNYLSATQLYVGLAYETAKGRLKRMKGDSKGLGHMERAIQSLKDAHGHLEEAMREIEG